MESKYKKRAEELFLQYSLGTSTNPEHNKSDYTIIDLMCQLAEEVEDRFIETIVELKQSKDSRYTKEQVEELEQKHQESLTSLIEIYDKNTIPYNKVEELLQKQRELCAEKVLLYKDTQLGKYYKPSEMYVDKDSILNAKLKLDEYE
jgi:serine phosphatase RsbU (regulator of sigma subunit)